VVNAGGIGILGGGSDPDELRANIAWIRERVGDKPFGIDLLLPASFVDGNKEDLESQIPQGHRDFVNKIKTDNDIPDPKEDDTGFNRGGDIMDRARRQLDVLIDEAMPIFASGLGSLAVVKDQLNAVGTKV